MELDTIFGLPAHPLLVHVPVVLVPLATTAALAALVVARWRRVLVVVALGLGVVAAVGTYLVQESGEPLEERVEETRGETELLEEHTDQGEQLLPFVVAFAALAGAAAAASARDRLRVAVVPLAVLALAAGAASTVQVTRIGHSGARAAWDDVTGDAVEEPDDDQDDGSGRGRGRGRGGDD